MGASAGRERVHPVSNPSDPEITFTWREVNLPTVQWGISEAGARSALQLYRDVLAGRGCCCGPRPCGAVYEAAHRDVTAVVTGHPELQKELRALAARLLAAR